MIEQQLAHASSSLLRPAYPSAVADVRRAEWEMQRVQAISRQQRTQREAGRRANGFAQQPQPPAQLLRSRGYEPRTELGRRLWALRSRIIASGQAMLGWDEIEEEVLRRRQTVGLEDK